MIKQLAHICIHTKDLEKTEDFYCNKLELSKKFNFYKNGRLFGFYLDLGNQNFLEFFYDPDAKNDLSPIKHFCLQVEDIDYTIAKLKSSGTEVTEKSWAPIKAGSAG